MIIYHVTEIYYSS